MHRHFDRRAILLGATGLAAATALPLLPAHAAAPLQPLAPAAGLIARTTTFLATLDDGARRAAMFPWGGRAWRNWNYFGVGGYIKPGLRLEQMTAPQQDAAWAMLAEVLSPQGLAKARTVMELQDILAEQGNGRGARSSRRFSWSVFGSPGAVGRWGLRVEGHHLSLSFAVADGEIVSVTPSAFAALPNRVTGGRRAGLVALQGEEQIARRIEQDLSASQRRRARVDEDKLFNILSSAGDERAHTRKVGLALADMQTGQRDLLWQLVETYAVEPFAAPIAEAQRSRIRMGDAEAVHFAWHGPNQAEVSFGYRVIADNVVIELGCIDGKAQHLHPVYHDLGNVLASDA